METTVTRQDLDTLTQKVDHLTTLVAELVATQRRQSEFIQEFTPISREVMDVAIHTLHEAEQQGLFRLAAGLRDITLKIAGNYDDADLAQLKHSVTGILDTVRNLTRPDILEILNEAGDVLHQSDHIQPLGVGGMIKAGADVDVQRGMAVMIEVMRHVGRVAQHLHGQNTPPRRLASPEIPPTAPPPASRKSQPAAAAAAEQEPTSWSEEGAKALAAAAGIPELTEAHWKVIHFAREEFSQSGISPNIRRITQGAEVSTRDLYTLFPKAPGRTVARIAGIPKPAGCI